MSIYKQLNDAQLNLSVYEEEPLAELERRSWDKRVRRKLRRHNARTSGRWAAAAAILVLCAGITMPVAKISLADVPLVSGLIEHFIGGEQAERPLDYSPYKTQIGETAVNGYGKLTLNEVLIDADNLLISSTFEPAKGIPFSYRSFLIPHVLVNGEDLQTNRGGQSVKVNDGMYTIYGDINFTHLPAEGPLRLTISYDERSGGMKRPAPIEEPWVFEVTVSTSAIGSDTEEVAINRAVTLDDGSRITLDRLISTPVSTVIYYDVNDDSERTYLKIVSASGQEWMAREGATDGGEGAVSNARFDPIDLEHESYWIVPVNISHEEIGPRIPLAKGP